MLQFDILSGSQAGTQSVARHFPFQIGRSSDADLQLIEPGVWDNHLTIEFLAKDRCFAVQCHEQATLSINGENVREANLRNGDLLQIGGTRLRVGLTPPVQRSSFLRENAIWFFLVAVSAAQMAIIYLLGK